MTEKGDNFHSLAYLAESKYQTIAPYFISHDRVNGRFVLRRHKSGRVDSRAAIINRIEQSVLRHGFDPSPRRINIGATPVVALIRAGTGVCPDKFLRLNHYPICRALAVERRFWSIEVT